MIKHLIINLKGLNWTKIVILVIMTVACYNVFIFGRWKKDQVIEWDAISYYAYLPATFIYKDLTLQFVDNYHGKHHFVIWSDKTPNGKNIIRTSMGLSFLYLPFFLIAHIIALSTHYDAGGYSHPYQLALSIAALTYFFLGLIFIRKFLKKYFSEIISALTILILVAGTNIFYYATEEGAFSHVFSFALIGLWVLLVERWHKSPNWGNSLLTGLLLGLISLIRPTNALVVILLLCYGKWKSLKEWLFFYFRNYKFLILIAISAFLIWIPQFIYWKYITGSYLFNSYGDQGRFFFNNPQIIKGLFSFQKGWLIYSPVMIFSVLGLFLLKKEVRKYRIGLILFFVTAIYVMFSWWCWWYGGDTE